MIWNTFISYRRRGGYLMAEHLYIKLNGNGITAYRDVHQSENGRFDEKIYKVIENCSNFVLVLSKGCFDRCLDEEDWVRREIACALRHNKNIVPVILDEYESPSADFWNNMPENFRGVPLMNGVNESAEYGDAMIQKLISLLVNINNIDKNMESKIVNNTIDFYGKCLKESEIQSIDMAFHGGNDWFDEDRHIALREEIIRNEIPVRILINTKEAASVLAEHMRYNRKRYVSFEDCADDWKQLQSDYSELVQVRIGNLPLLRIMHSIHFEDETKDRMLLKHYTYNNPNMSKNARSEFSRKNPYYSVYEDEFEYLWNLAVPVDEGIPKSTDQKL